MRRRSGPLPSLTCRPWRWTPVTRPKTFAAGTQPSATITLSPRSSIPPGRRAITRGTTSLPASGWQKAATSPGRGERLAYGERRGPGAGHGRGWPKETNLSPRAVDAGGKPAPSAR
jgi:hypothetical protein